MGDPARIRRARLLILLAGLATGLLACGPDTELVGTVERRMLELAAPISEVIVALPVDEGERVGAGDLLVQLDTQVVAADLRAHEAALAAAEAQLQEAEGVFARQQRLRQSNVATAQDLDNARRQRDEATAAVAQRQARIAQARKRLEDLTVRSFAAGVVDQLPFEIGERVPAGGVVAVVMAAEAPFVRLWIPARLVSRLTPGAAARVEIEGLDESFDGEVAYIARQSAFTPHYALTEEESAHLVFESRITIEKAPEGLRPGLPARVTLDL